MSEKQEQQPQQTQEQQKQQIDPQYQENIESKYPQNDDSEYITIKELGQNKYKYFDRMKFEQNYIQQISKEKIEQYVQLFNILFPK